MSSGKLYTYPENFRAYKALIAAQYSGAKVTVPKDFVFGQTNKTEAFLKKFPFGKVPAYEDANGTCVTESNAIAWHLATEQLKGGGGKAGAAQVIQWMSFADVELLPAVCQWTFPLEGIVSVDQTAMERGRSELAALLHTLNNHLLLRTYLVGERVTLADVVMACTLLPAYRLAMDPEFRRPYANVTRWFNTIVNQTQVKTVLGEVKLCDKPASVSTAAAGANKDNKKGKAEKNKKPAKAPAKKKEEPAEEVDAADEAVAAEPKSKDPFANFPKSSWVMDDFKRFYSNNDEDKSVPYFWEHFDKQNFSIWRCEYLYPEDLKMVFMTCNLVGGMFQRIDRMRKHAFGSMAIFGEDGNNQISGIWVWRGQELIFPLSDDWQIDYNSYKWTKLDADAPATKTLVDQYFKWTGKDEQGRQFNQGKIFK